MIHAASVVLLAISVLAGVGGVIIGSWHVAAIATLALAGLTAAIALWVNITVRRVARSVERKATAGHARLEAGITAALQEMRAKQSRHEYHQEAALTRIEQVVSAMRGDVEGLTWDVFSGSSRWAATNGRPRVLFVTSNGAGLGHLTRCAAVGIAGHAWFDSHVLSMSSAVPAMERLGLQWSYYPSQRAQNVEWGTWHRRFSEYIHGTVSDKRYDAVVFDGTWMYRALTETCRRFGVPLIWMLRGNWKSAADTSQIEDVSAHCDVVIRPGDLAGGPAPISGGVRIYDVDPIVISDVIDTVGRGEACARLGLSPDRKYVLVQLGAGVVNDISAARAAAVRAVHRIGPDWDVVVGQSVLATARVEASPRVHVVDAYPLAPLMSAFEFAVIAAGYNSTHEAVHARIPSIVWPNAETLTDWQERRAQGVQDKNFGVAVQGEDQLVAAVEMLANPAYRRTLTLPAKDSKDSKTAKGAQAAASVIESVISSVRKGRE